MKKKLYLLLSVILINSYADCVSQKTAYQSVETYLNTCKNDPIDCSHGDPRCGLCPTLMTNMAQAMQTLALSPTTQADLSCVDDPNAKTLSIIQFKTKLDLNSQYGWVNPCTYSYPLTQTPPAPPSSFSEYMSVLYANFCF